MQIEQRFSQLLNEAKTNKKLLIRLKTAAVTSMDFELAVELREMEKQLFPDSPEVQTAKNEGEEFTRALQMVGLNVPPSSAWLVFQTAKKYIEMGDGFGIKQASAIQVQRDRLFESD